MSCSCLCPIHWSHVWSREWRCGWSSADRRCCNYIWVINNFIVYWDVTYIRGLTVELPVDYHHVMCHFHAVRYLHGEYIKEEIWLWGKQTPGFVCFTLCGPMMYIFVRCWGLNKMAALLQMTIFKYLFLKENSYIMIPISLLFVREGPIHNKSALIQVMACCLVGNKPLPEPLMSC